MPLPALPASFLLNDLCEKKSSFGPCASRCFLFDFVCWAGIQRATSTLRNVESAWVKDMNVMIENNQVTAYKVNLAITFVLEEGEAPASSG